MTQTRTELIAAAEGLSQQIADLFDHAASATTSDEDAATAMMMVVSLILRADQMEWTPVDGEDASLTIFRDLLTHAASLSRENMAGSISTSEWAADATALAAWSRDDRPALA